MARSQTWGVLGSPLTPWMDPHCIGICNVGVHLGSPMAKAMGPQLGVLCGSERPDPKIMLGGEPQRPKGWTPNSACIGIPNGQSNGTPTWGAPWFLRSDPKMMWGWEPQRPKGWIPKSQGAGVPNGQSNGSQSWGALWFLRAGPQTHVGLGSPMAKAMGAKLGVSRGPSWPDPKLGVCWDPH